MKYVLAFVFIFCFLPDSFCQVLDNKKLEAFFKEYTEDSYRIFPLTATFNGDPRYNDLLPASFTDSNIELQKVFYNKFLNGIKKFDRNALNDNDKISYDIFKRDMEIALEGLSYKMNLIPFTQFSGLVRRIYIFRN